MMDNRKRQRLDVPRTGAPLIALNGSTNDISSAATLLAAGQNTFFLDNGNELSPLSGDVFLTICDENLSEDESQEFFTIDSETLAAHIKQEQEIGTQTISSLPQIRILNAHPPQQQTTQPNHPPEQPTQRSALNSPATTTIQLTGNNSSSLLPASMQLPSGCEIYLVKEYIQSPSSTSSNLTVTSTTETVANSPANIEIIEPSKNIKIETNKLNEIIDKDSSTSSSSSSHHALITRNNQHYVLNGKTKATPAGQANNTTSKVHQTQQHNVLLDAYKKRDDKRRATHNEVERRRRDKINSWIFKLKEMLPTDFSNNNNSNNTNNNNSFNNNNDNLKINLVLAASATIPNASSSSSTPVLPTLQNSFPNGTVRPPPNDSKSQILIKACDYIKSMQEELKCLRECIAENEDLRIKNEQLENELHQLRNERNLNNLQNGNSSSFNLTLSSLNNDNSIFGNTSTVSVGNLNSNGAQVASNSSSPITTFTKRELIIRDFVD